MLKHAWLVGCLGLVGTAAHAQVVLGGASGATQDLVVNQNTTLQLPPDGRLVYRSITVNSATLTFTPNAANTPVYLLSEGPVVINGTISVNGAWGTATAGGAGGPGGFDGGAGSSNAAPAGAGRGPGGGAAGTGTGQTSVRAGAGHYAAFPSDYGPRSSQLLYGGPLLIPLVGGSGAGGGAGLGGGGGGGGAIVVASNDSIQVGGTVSAQGGLGWARECSSDHSGHGSGGAIRLVAPTVRGSGTLNASGGAVCSVNGGAGRIRVDALDRSAFNPGVAGVVSYGNFLAVNLPNMPALQIVSVGGQAVTPGSSASVILPFNAPATQIVRVRASGFGPSPTAYDVVVTPDSGQRSVYSTTCVNTSAGPDERDIQVQIPANNFTRVDVFSKPTPCTP